MDCVSCKTTIPPNWVHAIQSNLCPACGGSIMDSERKDLLEELTEAIKSMNSNPEGLAGWLIDTFHLQKNSEGEIQPTEFYGKPAKRTKKDSSSDPRIPGLQMKTKSNPSAIDLLMAKNTGQNKKFNNLVDEINGNSEDDHNYEEENFDEMEELDERQPVFMPISNKQDKRAIRAAIQQAGQTSIILAPENGESVHNMDPSDLREAMAYSLQPPSSNAVLAAIELERQEREERNQSLASSLRKS